jgi:hypothetical protein
MIRVPTGKFCHSYVVEIHAIKAAPELLFSINLGTQPVVFLTDARLEL